MKTDNWLTVTAWGVSIGLSRKSGRAWILARRLPEKYRRVIAGRLCIRADAPAPERKPVGRPRK